MGTKRDITLQEAQALFPTFALTNLEATKNGTTDTTYLLDNYILKYYERDIKEQIEVDALRLQLLQAAGLRVSTLLASHENWYLYERLEGTAPTTTSYYHIQALGIFMAKLHQQSLPAQKDFIESYKVEEKLFALKKFSFYYYKKLEKLRDFTGSHDGFIHADIFKDNTVFHKNKIAVFDFIDGGLGSFAFDIAVALLSFNPKNKPSLNTFFVSTYNQHSTKKIDLKTVQKHREIAAMFYALLRIDARQNIQRVKELM